MKSKNKQHLSSYVRAKKRVEDIKGFYGHLTIYIIINLVLLLSRNNFRFILINNSVLENTDVLEWLDWNIFGTPIVWGFFLVIHAIVVFGKNPFLGKSWEDRQIQKYLEKDQAESEKHN